MSLEKFAKVLRKLRLIYQWAGKKAYVETAKASEGEKAPAAHHPQCTCMWCR